MKNPMHVTNCFQFVVRAPLTAAAALFAPEAERSWVGPEWNPEFVYPQPGADVPGAVFTVQHGAKRSVWVNTRFELEGGRMQYVSFLPDTTVSTVDVCLTAVDAAKTSVEVTYSRIALDASANELVEAMGASDREKGPHWQEAIERYLYR
jgi:hypothetical protein